MLDAYWSAATPAPTPFPVSSFPEMQQEVLEPEILFKKVEEEWRKILSALAV